MLEKKVALVTGASSGIGYEITKLLASKGYTVYAAARRTTPIKPLEEEFPEKVIAISLDVSDLQQIQDLKTRFARDLPDSKLHILYNNAGQSCTFPAVDVGNDKIEQCFKVNVFGPMNLCREMSDFVINARGTIVFTGSLAGIVPFPFGSIYSSTKAAIHQYARVLHVEMKPFGVKVINAITGGVATNIADTRPLLEDSVFNTPEGRHAFETRQNMAKNNKPMSPAVYAKKLVADVESSSDPVDVYRGAMATVMSWVMLLVPYNLLEWGLYKKFHLDDLFHKLSERKKQE